MTTRLIQRTVWNSENRDKTATVTMSVREPRPQIAVRVTLPRADYSEYFFTEEAARVSSEAWSTILAFQGFVRGDFEVATVDSYRPHIR